jgi:hypothetical protein
MQPFDPAILATLGQYGLNLCYGLIGAACLVFAFHLYTHFKAASREDW